MKRAKPPLLIGMVLAATMCLSSASAQAQSVEDFYQGKTITLVVSAAPGGSSDYLARELANFYGKHIPGNPAVVVVNQPGAGGMVAAAQLQLNQPRDGTVIALLQRNNLYRPLLDAGEQFDPREVSWLGSLTKETYAISVWEGAPVETAEDLFTTPLIMGATGFVNETRTLPAMMNAYMGTKFEIIHGYSGSEEVGLAMERGEVQGKAGTTTNLLSAVEANWQRDGKLRVLMQVGLADHPSFPDVPNILSFIEDPDTEAAIRFMIAPFEAGRPLAAPPDVPADRLDALRAAFDATVADPEFVAHMERQGQPLEPIPGLAVEEIVTGLYATPEPILAKVRAVLAAE